MTPGEFVDAALRAYRSLGWPLLEACLLPALFGLAGLTFLTDIVFPDMFSTSDPSNMQVQFSEVVVALVLGLTVASPLLLIGAAYVSALAVFLVADFMVGNVPNLKNARAAAARLFQRTFAFILRQTVYASSGLILGIFVLMASAWINQMNPGEGSLIPAIAGVLAVVAFGVGGVMFFVVVGYDCLALPAMIYEGLPMRAAIKRGRELLKSGRGVPHGGGHVLALWCFIVFMLIFLLAGLAALYSLVTSLVGVDSAQTSQLTKTLIGLVPSFLVVWLLLPIWGVCTTILYFERRVRKEAFDVDLLAQDVWSSQKNARFVL